MGSWRSCGSFAPSNDGVVCLRAGGGEEDLEKRPLNRDTRDVFLCAAADGCPGCVLQCVAVCCSALQCVAVRCSVLQCVAVCYSVLQCVTVCCKCVAVCCRVLQCVAVCRSVSQCVAVRCSVLQYVAVCCSVCVRVGEGEEDFEQNPDAKKCWCAADS